MRRIAAWFAIGFGVTLIAFTFGEHLVSRSRDAQRIADHYQPLGLVGPVIGQMQAARSDYARASDIPTSWLPLSSAPWLFLGIGFLLIAAGTFALVRPQPLANAALLVIGVGLVIAPLVISIPSKVDAAVRVTKLGAVGLAPATGQKAVGATRLFDAMVTDVRTTLAPALGEAAPGASFAQKYATLAGFADEWQRSTSAKSHALSDSQVALSRTLANANRIPLRPIPWLFIIPGSLLALLAGAALVPAFAGAPAQARRTGAIPA